MKHKEGKTPDELMSTLDSVSDKAKTSSSLMQLKVENQNMQYQELIANKAELSCRNGTILGMNSDAGQKCRKYIYSMQHH